MKFTKSLLSVMVMSALAASTLYANKPTETKSAGMTSAEMGSLATIAAVDSNEILLGTVAANKKVSSGVTDFANMMIDQHGNNLTQLLSMVKNNALNSGEASKLTAEGKKELLKLGAMDGSTFGTAYVNAMVKGHEAVLNLIDKQLMKTAKTDEVKQFLTDTRNAVAMHLEHAKKLQSEQA